MRVVVCALMLTLMPMPAVAQAANAPGPRTFVRLEVPLVKQPYNLCLAASVSMVLKYLGVDVAPATIGSQVPVYKDGTTGQDLVRFVEKIGLSGFLVQPPFEDLLFHLDKRRPLIVVLPAGKTGRHAVVLTGYDTAAQVVWVNDPASGQARSIPFAQFRTEWDVTRRWTMLIVSQ